jgi:hypothetical protein
MRTVRSELLFSSGKSMTARFLPVCAFYLEDMSKRRGPTWKLRLFVRGPDSSSNRQRASSVVSRWAQFDGLDRAQQLGESLP